MDFSQKARELEIDESLYVALLKTFEKHLAEDLSTMERALLDSDRDALFSAAHSIKGASGSLNLQPIYDAASQICTSARGGLAVSVDPQLSILRDEMATLSRLLSRRVEGAADEP